MIRVIFEKEKIKTEPHYLLIYNYMIGDANGETTKEVKLTLENPYIERYVTLLNNLNPPAGRWGLTLEEDRIEECFEQGQLIEEDYNFLLKTMFNKKESGILDKDLFLYQFSEGVRTVIEHNFLVFESADLMYIDENGEEFATEFI